MGRQMLLRKADRRALPLLYYQDGKKGDAVVYVKFFAPWTNWTWYATEASIRVPDGELVRLTSDPAQDRAPAFSPDGQTLASSGNDGDIILWDVTSQQPIAFLRAHEERVNDLAFSPDGQLLASASWDKTILLWDVASGQITGLPLAEHADWVTSVSFAPQGDLLASASADGTILIWDLASVTPRQAPLTGHGNRVRSVAFSPDGLRLASAGEDNAVILWDASTGQQIGASLDGHDDKVWETAFSPDGNALASISNDATCVLWDVSLVSWQTRACHRANRNLSPDEWEQFIGDVLPYEPICAGLAD